MSTMASTCSMSTGHSSTQAPQVTHDQSTSGSIVFGTRVSGAPSEPSAVLASNLEAWENMLSRRPMMTSFGERGLPVFQAGQTDWQRPPSVQVGKSSICFQVNCSTPPTPKTVSSVTFSMSMSGVLSRPPRARGRRDTPTLIGAKKMCRCLEYETKTRNPAITETLSKRNTASRTELTPTPSGASQLAAILLAKAHGEAKDANTCVVGPI